MASSPEVMPLNLHITEKLSFRELYDTNGEEEELLFSRINTLEQCEYYSPIAIPNQNSQFSSPNFKLMHVNARSLVKNGERMKDFLHNSNLSMNSILVTETWLRDSQPENQITNFSFCGQNRGGKAGGGVGIYLRNEENFVRREDLMSNKPAMENLSVEINRGHCKNIIISCIYRPPDGNIEQFFDEFHTLLNKVSKMNKIILIGGDFNLNLLQSKSDNRAAQFTDLLFSHNIFPTISRPTRVGLTSNTLIDGIFTNSMNPGTSGVIIELTISDHFPIILDIDIGHIPKPIPPGTVQRRKINPDRLQELSIWLQRKFEKFVDITCPNEATQCLSSAIEIGVNTFLPIQKHNRKASPIKPWVTPAILISINENNILYNIFLKNKTCQHLAEFKAYKNRFLVVIREAKKKYYQELLKKNEGNSKRTWQILKEVIGKGTCRTSQITRIKIQNRQTTDHQEIANHLNSFFTTIGPTLADSLPASNIDPASFIHHSSPHSCFLAPVTAETVREILLALDNKSNGIEPISNSILKKLSSCICQPIAHLVNLCFTSGEFPQQLKTATVTPVYKAGNRDEPGNYRPISVISPLSKIIEKCISIRIHSFIHHHGILSDSQYGFRTNHSTEHALLKFIDYASTEKEKGNIVLGIYLDIKKAFDSVNFKILFRKLDKYGIRGKSLDLIKSYLRSRRQRVKINSDTGIKTMSEEKVVQCGVPQGSVLGPLLFLLYVNDLKNASKEFRTITFADDTNVFLSGPRLEELFAKANTELAKLKEWFVCNQLCLNIQKTSYQLYTCKSMADIPQLAIHNVSIQRAKEVKFLGLIVDEDLSFKSHICYVAQKLSIAAGLMYRGRQILEKSQLLSIYNSLALPHLNYCSLI